MVGGIVIEVCEVRDRPEVLFVDCQDRRDTCAIYVENNATSQKIEVGDSLWWQGRSAFWTPKRFIGKEHPKQGVEFDIVIPRIGYSGVSHPSRAGT